MNVRILICDDELEEIEKLQNLLVTYGDQNDVNFHITACSSPQEIEANLRNSTVFEILFLDIYIDQLNGMDLAKMIRKNNAESKIIFVSTSPNHALEAFGVHASQYLVKPVAYQDFAATMDLLLEPDREGRFIHVTCGNEVVKIFLRDLIYVETQRHYQALFLANGSSERTRMTRAEILEHLGTQKRFIPVGASYLVNLDYVRRITADGLSLTNNEIIHAPRRALAELKQKYFDYYCGEEVDAP